LNSSRFHLPAWLVWFFVAAVSMFLAFGHWPVEKLWPPLASVIVILVTRNALLGLLTGGFVGAFILSGGHPVVSAASVFTDHLWPSLQSPWKIGAIIFTLVLGGFASILEAGGGFTRLMHKATGSGSDSHRRLESAAAGLGILCFFDGLANSMVVGRVSRDLADQHGVARAKLAYIVDSTSSAVACLAFVSTWIAFQLSMIGDAFALAGRTVNPYAIFLQSLPYNFYCWFTLVMLFVAIRSRFHPGPMGHFVADLKTAKVRSTDDINPGVGGSAVSSLLPLAILMIAFFLGFVVMGSPHPIWPLDKEKIVAAFGSDAGPAVLVTASFLATLVALVMFPKQSDGKWKPALKAFLRGVHTMVAPIFILLAAWVLGSVISDLGTAALISQLATSSNSLALLPALTFLTGAVISFSTGTSWGTMGILFPLAVPAAAALGADDSFLTIIVAAVFSGAVFGDHCSPFSDTTIVSSISCGVTPHDHVRTQIPYALITASVAIGLGFLPAGFGVSGWGLLLAGSVALLLLGRFARTTG
jgi:tetracycline resistance efflux pump